MNLTRSSIVIVAAICTAPDLASYQSICTDPDEDRIFDQQLAVYPYSVPLATTSSPEGDYFFIGEGGGLADRRRIK
jgi:hypothetical protein